MSNYNSFRLEPDDRGNILSESILRHKLISSGQFTASETAQAIKEAIDGGQLTKLGYDILGKN